MRSAILIASIVVLSGCANPYADFYQGAQDARLHPRYEASQGAPTIQMVADPEASAKVAERRGFQVIGISSFTGGDSGATERNLLEQATKVGASVVFYSVKYLGSQQTTVPITMPDVRTTYSSGTATAYGAGGPVRAYGTGTSTTYGTQTTYVPITTHRHEYVAAYLAKFRYRLGARCMDLPDEVRQRMGSNSGCLVKSVVDGSPAFSADIMGGDVIVSVDGERVAGQDGYQSWLDRVAAGKATLSIWRPSGIVSKTVDILP